MTVADFDGRILMIARFPCQRLVQMDTVSAGAGFQPSRDRLPTQRTESEMTPRPNGGPGLCSYRCGITYSSSLGWPNVITGVRSSGSCQAVIGGRDCLPFDGFSIGELQSAIGNSPSATVADRGWILRSCPQRGRESDHLNGGQRRGLLPDLPRPLI